MAATKTLVKVAEYRSLYGALTQAFVSLRSAATPAERVREAAWVRSAACKLMAVDCRRLDAEDRQMGENLIDRTASYLLAAGL